MRFPGLPWPVLPAFSEIPIHKVGPHQWPQLSPPPALCPLPAHLLYSQSPPFICKYVPCFGCVWYLHCDGVARALCVQCFPAAVELMEMGVRIPRSAIPSLLHILTSPTKSSRTHLEIQWVIYAFVCSCTSLTRMGHQCWLRHSIAISTRRRDGATTHVYFPNSVHDAQSTK